MDGSCFRSSRLDSLLAASTRSCEWLKLIFALSKSRMIATTILRMNMIPATHTEAERISWSPKEDSVLFYLILNKKLTLNGTVSQWAISISLSFFLLTSLLPFFFPFAFPFPFFLFTSIYWYETMGFFTEDIQKTSVSLYIGKHSLLQMSFLDATC